MKINKIFLVLVFVLVNFCSTQKFFQGFHESNKKCNALHPYGLFARPCQKKLKKKQSGPVMMKPTPSVVVLVVLRQTCSRKSRRPMHSFPQSD